MCISLCVTCYMLYASRYVWHVCVCVFPTNNRRPVRRFVPSASDSMSQFSSNLPVVSSEHKKIPDHSGERRPFTVFHAERHTYAFTFLMSSHLAVTSWILYIYTHTYVGTYVYIHIYIYIHICRYICVYIYIYVYKRPQREGHPTHRIDIQRDPSTSLRHPFCLALSRGRRQHDVCREDPLTSHSFRVLS